MSPHNAIGEKSARTANVDVDVDKALAWAPSALMGSRSAVRSTGSYPLANRRHHRPASRDPHVGAVLAPPRAGFGLYAISEWVDHGAGGSMEPVAVSLRKDIDATPGLNLDQPVMSTRSPRDNNHASNQLVWSGLHCHPPRVITGKRCERRPKATHRGT